MKMLFQTLCTTSMKWDDEFEGTTLTGCNSFVGDLPALNDVRRYFRCIDDSFRVHEMLLTSRLQQQCTFARNISMGKLKQI